ncbi:MAG: M28 family peptidase [Proteobacteria bacterium]|nr:M28 family peptidase [Pseudomonadota bacterium]
MNGFRSARWARLVSIAAAGVGLAGCASTSGESFGRVDPEPSRSAAPETPPAPPQPGVFSASRAWGHLEALAAIGPRPTGSAGSLAARTYISEQLQAMGLEVLEQAVEVQLSDSDTPLDGVHLTAVLPGDAPDIFLLAAHYDTATVDGVDLVGANAGASGPALLLELARAWSEVPRPYTLWFVFVDADEIPRASGGTEAGFLGSRGLAQSLASDGRLERIRLAVFFDQVADVDLQIARDLRSHSVYRDVFWQAARDLGRGAAFPTTYGFESPALGHHAFLEQDLRRVVAIVDHRYGSDETPGPFWRSADDNIAHCAPESLETVGLVSIEAINRIAKTLRKIDRFVRSPLDEPDAEDPVVSEAAEPTPEVGESAEPTPESEPGAEAPSSAATPGSDAASTGSQSEEPAAGEAKPAPEAAAP